MTNERFNNVWDALKATPIEAENMRLRSELMIAIGRHIERQGWTQAEAAAHLGVTQPRISDLIRGKIARFGLESLVDMAAQAGLRMELRITESADRAEKAA